MHAAAEDLCGDYPDIVPNDTRNLMGFFMMLRKLLAEVFACYWLQIFEDTMLIPWIFNSAVSMTSRSRISPNQRMTDSLKSFHI